ncbi:MAG: pseudouridine-5'-phosphate glycosidase [Nocardioidaceae bacterium]
MLYRVETPRIAEPVRAALQSGRPVVALESTIIAHGLPRPRNLAAARDFEERLRHLGVVPATVAVLDGVVCVGLSADELQRVAEDDDMVKVSVRDLPVVVATRRCGATTVAATAHLARRAGIRVFATGGLGGVHRLAAQTFDESADLTTLAQTTITVVSAGVKSILDVPATLERLESLGVTVVGWRTRQFPGFWITDSGSSLDWSVPDAATVAEVMAAGDALGRSGAILVANPLPVAEQLDPQLHDRALAEALDAAERRGLRGKAVSPFLLGAMVAATKGASLEVNLALAAHNVDLAGDIAVAWARLQSATSAGPTAT